MDEKQNLIDMLEYTELMFAKNEHQFSSQFKTKQMAEVIFQYNLGLFDDPSFVLSY